LAPFASFATWREIFFGLSLAPGDMLHGGNLSGFRVLDLTTEAGFLAGKLLGDLGADVVKVEPPGGDPARRRGPFAGGIEDPERSVLWLALNTSKRGISLDLESESGRETFRSLCRSADAVLESAGPGWLEARGLGVDVLRALNPGLVLCRISPFGQEGPYASWRGSDLVAVAMGGNMYPTGNPERAPVRCTLPIAYYHGGIEAALGVAFALWGRESSGRGQVVDVSLQEAMVMPNMTTPAQYPLTGFKGGRIGGGFRGGRAQFRELWPCKDGYVSFALRGGPARIPGILALVAYMREHDMAPPALSERDWKTYNHNLIAQGEVDEIERSLGAFFATKTMQELYDAACERRLMLAPAITAREIQGSRQLATREFLVDVEHAELGTAIRLPGPFARSSAGGIGIRRRAPRLGEHEAEILGVGDRGPGAGREKSAAAAPQSPTPDPRSLFSGLKILEFGGGAAGPLGTRYFADHGATVVRIESRQRPDFIRLLRYTPGVEGGLDASHMFAMVNCNKLGVALDMSHPKGPEIARRLVEWADVVAENFSPKAMTKWGLDYESLERLKPGLVMISTCLNGQTGPERDYPGFGGQGSALSGFNHLTGWPDKEPLGPYGTITDSLSPRFVALLVSSALIRRQRTGEGQYIDLSQVEGGIVCLSENMATYSATGEVLGRLGNRSRHAAPHGAFRCAAQGDDDDRWVAIAVQGDDEWQRLRGALGDPAWAAEARFATAAGRLAHVDDVERLVEGWTRGRAAENVAATLQAAGIDAGVVQNFEDLSRDPQLAARRHFRPVHHRVVGDHLCEMMGLRFSETPGDIRTPAPCLGEHTQQVMREMLGMSAAEYAELEAQGVFK
jgi:crotonobetainyl-CoA:carnitine CoA-transferase CaiB-like acyl-CoA transferase